MNKAKRISTFIILSMLFIASMCAFLFYGISGVDALSENGKPEIEMIDGASVRNDTEKSGLRFSALINDGYFQSGTTLKDGFSAGMLIIDTDSYDESIALTHESKESNYAGRVLEVAAQVFDSNSDYSVDGQTVFNAVVTNIPDNAYGYSVRSRLRNRHRGSDSRNNPASRRGFARRSRRANVSRQGGLPDIHALFQGSVRACGAASDRECENRLRRNNEIHTHHRNGQIR